MRKVLWGNPVHPTSSAQKKDRVGVTSLFRCIQCGFCNDSNKTVWSKQGEGYERGTDANGNVEMQNRTGCGNCGSHNWRKSKPPKVRDDRYTADPMNPNIPRNSRFYRR